MPTDTRTVTPKRRAANQAAAQKSTGPKTEEGKQRAAFNSFKHGAFAEKEHTLQEAFARSGAEPAELNSRRQQLLDDWKPATHQQELLVGDLAWLYWLRDQAAGALVQAQAKQRLRAQLDREQRRFDARHRARALHFGNYNECGCVSLAGSESKFIEAAAMLDDLDGALAKAAWSDKVHDRFEPMKIISSLFGDASPTLRGQKIENLWWACLKEEAKANDPRVSQIRALLEEERAALAEEAELFHRRQELDIELGEEDDFSGLHPLGEAWQRAVIGIERLDRQINAKIRLLLRLQANPARASARAGADLQVCDGEGSHSTVSAPWASPRAGADLQVCDGEGSHSTVSAPWASPSPSPTHGTPDVPWLPDHLQDQKITGTKPTKPLESTKQGVTTLSNVLPRERNLDPRDARH